MDYIRGVVERITFQNQDTGFSIIKCSVKGQSDLVTGVGNMADVHGGSVLGISGDWKTDRKYGKQFMARKWEETLPATAYGIQKYLGSGLIKGIGPHFAGKIVALFGENTLNVIETDPDALLQIPGIGARRVERIKQSWAEQKEIRNIMLFLQEHDVSTALAARIYKAYGDRSVEVVKNNPYQLADDIWGIGFKTADTIAAKLGTAKDSFARLRSGLFYTLNHLSENDGHCYAGREMLVKKAVDLLGVEACEIQTALDELIRSSELIRDPADEDAIYLPVYYNSEVAAADRLCRIMAANRNLAADPDALMQRVTSASSVSYDSVQLQAIRQAVTAKVMVLTGGPGTGKTTTTMGIISAYRTAGCRILLAAPTGRAAKRMSETTGMEAKTIHRLLEYSPQSGYQKNAENPLDADVLIVDEFSMVDLMLFNHLLKAVPETMTLIMVGDVDQLPSVGAGNVLRDIIDSGVVPVVRLTRIFRQAQGSRIIMNAHRINRGEMPDLRGGADSDFFFAAKDTGEETAETVVQFCTRNLPQYYHADARKDIQVLTPMQRGPCGAAALNQLLQNAMNPSAVYLTRSGTQYRLNDKVMQIRNNYDKDVFNGDIGIVVRVNTEEDELTVSFDGRDVAYDITELDELVLAYATTIHKAQGSEYPIVVMPFTMAHYIMLQRNLLYTGVTRAKRALIIVGERKALSYAVRNAKITARNTRLAARLQAGTGRVSPQRSGSPDRKAPAAPASLGNLFSRLSRSEFRSRFRLSPADRQYVREKGMDVIRSHAQDFVRTRLAPANPRSDGKQTPMRGHPVFIAQHATATCCRDCLRKWHGIPMGKELTESQQEYVVTVIMTWIARQMDQEKGTRE